MWRTFKQSLTQFVLSALEIRDRRDQPIGWSCWICVRSYPRANCSLDRETIQWKRTNHRPWYRKWEGRRCVISWISLNYGIQWYRTTKYTKDCARYRLFQILCVQEFCLQFEKFWSRFHPIFKWECNQRGENDSRFWA